MWQFRRAMRGCRLRPLTVMWMYEATLKPRHIHGLDLGNKNINENGQNGAGKNKGPGAKRSSWGGKIYTHRYPSGTFGHHTTSQ